MKQKEIRILPFTLERLADVIAFEKQLREEEDVWGWEIDEEYLNNVRQSFLDDTFNDSVSLLAYVDDKAAGRIDASMISSRFDGVTRAYLDWICVLKSYRHQGIAQALLEELKRQLKERGITSLVALTAANEEAQSFYKAIPDSEMHDIGIWIDIR